jgi:hypothetical protein
MDMECEAFLEPLGMTYLLGKLAECGCASPPLCLAGVSSAPWGAEVCD